LALAKIVGALFKAFSSGHPTLNQSRLDGNLWGGGFWRVLAPFGQTNPRLSQTIQMNCFLYLMTYACISSWHAGCKSVSVKTKLFPPQESQPGLAPWLAFCVPKWYSPAAR
jgi:hypothetical protein